MKCVFLLTCLVMTLAWRGLAWGLEICGWNSSVQTANTLEADSYVEARAIFFAYPGEDPSLPSWSATIEGEFSDYIQVMSGGAQELHLEIARRPDAPNLAWLSDYPASSYPGGYVGANADAMIKVNNAFPGYWQNVEQVFIFHYKCLGVCGVAGQTGFQMDPAIRTQLGFTGDGTFQHDDTLPSGESQKYVAMHEYGHRLNFGHTASGYSSCGQYDQMTYNSSHIKGMLPYHPMWLKKAGWLTIGYMQSDQYNLPIPDIFSSSLGNRVAYVVQVPNSPQYFLLVNHQGLTTYDAKYQGTGLLVWHILRTETDLFERIWDPELRTGKFTNGEPDPILGLDRLDSDPTYSGSQDDFYVPGTSFGSCPTSNPNSNLYALNTDFQSPQNVLTGISIENIRFDPNTHRMIVDVIYSPKQRLTSLMDGADIQRGNVHNVTWSPRTESCISFVNLEISDDLGQSFQLLQGAVENTGSYFWRVLELPGTYIFKVITHGANGLVGSAESQVFTVIDDDRDCP